MLVLVRKLKEGIFIGDAVVRVEKIGKNYISLSIDAPDDVKILVRKLKEGIFIGDAVVRVEKIGKNYISLSIDAPDDVKILREELVTFVPVPSSQSPQLTTHH